VGETLWHAQNKSVYRVNYVVNTDETVNKMSYCLHCRQPWTSPVSRWALACYRPSAQLPTNTNPTIIHHTCTPQHNHLTKGI